jgi:putative transposase
MSRPLRIEFDGAFYHICARGNERKAIFKENKDKKHFLHLLEFAHSKYQATFHAYVLMDNHYHLILETPKAGLSKIIHSLNTAYTLYFNKKYQRFGHLFQGRYRSVIIEADSYLLALSRYIHLNPVRAGIVKNPEDYPWSSYLAYIGKEAAQPWLRRDLVLVQGSKEKKAAYKAYKEFTFKGLREGIANPLEDAYKGFILGKKEFIEKVMALSEEKPEIPQSKNIRNLLTIEKIHELVKDALSGLRAEEIGLKDPIKAVAVYLCKRHLGQNNAIIGEYFGGLHYSAVTKIAQRIQAKKERNQSFAQKLEKLERDLSNFKT